MAITRRTTLSGLIAAGTGLAVNSAAQAKMSKGPKGQSTSANFNPPIQANKPDTFEGLLLNQARAMDVMAEAKVDLLLCATKNNFYYMTNYRPPSFLLGMGGGLDFAVLSAHGYAKPTMITSSITLYFSGMPQSQADALNIQQFTIPVDPKSFASLVDPREIAAAKAYPSFLPREDAHHPLTKSEEYRRALATFDPAAMAASAEAAIIREVLDNPLPNKTIAIDDHRLRPIIEKAGLDVRVVDGEQLIRNIRVQKSDAELKMMRYAATTNAASGRATAMAARDGASFQDLRAEFHKQAGMRGMNAHFMMIDTVIPDTSGGTISEGRSFLIDCVSTFEGYHGDYGRTVCIGEPTREMQMVIDGLAVTWDRLREELRPGMDYNTIRARGLELFKDLPIDTGLALNPHSCGLNHSDDPNFGAFGDYVGRNTTLQENMVLSIDMPFLDNGFGGSAHLEDLVIIKKDGPELLNDSSDRFIVV